MADAGRALPGRRKQKDRETAGGGDTRGHRRATRRPTVTRARPGAPRPAACAGSPGRARPQPLPAARRALIMRAWRLLVNHCAITRFMSLVFIS